MRWLSKDEEAALRAIAERHGYLAGSGPHAGQGSANYLIGAIIKGELATVLLEDDDRRWLIHWLEEQPVADQTFAEVPRAIARQLRAAAIQEEG